MKVKETTLVVEDGDGAVVWQVGGRAMARVAGVASIEAESVEALEEWARRLVVACQRAGDGAPTPVGQMMTWGEVQAGDEVWYRGRYCRVIGLRHRFGAWLPVNIDGFGWRDVSPLVDVKVRRAPVGAVA